MATSNLKGLFSNLFELKAKLFLNKNMFYEGIHHEKPEGRIFALMYRRL